MASRFISEVDNAAFFTSVNGDRPYSARDFVRYLGSAVGNGVIDPSNLGGTTTGPYCVTTISNLTITVNSGSALLGGKYGYLANNESTQEISFTRPTNTSYSRWDRVVLHLDNTTSGGNERTIKIAVVEGTEGASPAQPGATALLTQDDVTNGGVYELLLFDVYVPSTTSGSPVSVDYTHTPYVQYETKENKVALIAGSETSLVKYPSVKSLVDYALPLAGGTLTGNLYLGGNSIYDVLTIYSQSSQNISIQTVTSGKNIRLLTAGSGVTNVEISNNESNFNTWLTADRGITVAQNVSGYAIDVTSGITRVQDFVMLGSMQSDLDMDSNTIKNSLVQLTSGIEKELGARNEEVYAVSTSQAGTQIDTLTNDSNGYTFPMSEVINSEAKTLKISFSAAQRNGSFPYSLSYGIAVAEVDVNGLHTIGGNSGFCYGFGHFVVGSSARLYRFTIQQQSGGGIKIYDPKFTDTQLNASQEDDIWIHRIEITY